MKHSASSSLSVLFLMIGTLSLVGCGAAAVSSSTGSSGSTGSTSVPDAVPGPAVSGSVFGGHAPIVGSHVYLLQPGRTGYGSMATSLLGTGTSTSPGGYPLHTSPGFTNGGDPYIPAGWQYVVTDAQGAWSLTGAYSCTPGYPVYTYSYGGNATGGTANNSAIVQLAILGLCPSSGQTNFGGGSSNPINYVYSNEVSTVAAAYVFQPFTVQGTTTTASAIYVGFSTSAQSLLGIQNAANTAAQLYAVQGNGQQSTVYDGEGHIANYRTQAQSIVGNTIQTVPNAGNGVVPQATIDTLANILAACVDSTGSTAAQCTTLFNNATETGDSTGATPTDIARATMNIARYPAGNYSNGHSPTTFVSNIFGIPTGTVPYTPNLGAHQPNDFTIAINYPFTPVGGYNTSNPDVQKAESIAVDASGQIWITAQGSGSAAAPEPSADRWSPLGAPSGVSNPSSYIYGYVSVDSSNNAWTGSANASTGIFYASGNGQFNTTYGSGYQSAYTIITDPAGDAYFFAQTAATKPNYGMFEYLPNGTLSPGSPYSISPTTTTTPVTGQLTISNATVSHANNTYTYTFTATNPGLPTGASAMVAGQTVTLSLNNKPASGGTGVGTNWTNLNGNHTVATASSTGFTITSTTNQSITNRGEGSGTYAATTSTTVPGAVPAGDNVAHGAIDATGNFWLTTELGTTIARVNSTGVTQFPSITATGQPEFPAIDSSNNAIIPLQENAGPIYKVTPTGTVTQLTSTTTGATLLYPFGSAIDGNGNIWVTDRCGPASGTSNFNTCVTTLTGAYSTLIELNGSNDVAISPPANYLPEAMYPANSGSLVRVLSDPLNIAVDPSGNLWISNYNGAPATNGGQVVEIIGIAAPVVTPLSAAAGSNSLGAKP